MKKLKLIYNPHSGDQSFKYALDPCVHAFQNGGYETHLIRTREPEDIEQAIANMREAYDAVVVAGGDGTVNLAVNALMHYNRNIPLGIIPAGTANDFAGYIRMPKDPEEAAMAIMKGRVIKTDLGHVNGKYFINVCGAGLFTNISQQLDKPLKDSLGVLAYYLKGIEQLSGFLPFPVRITTPTHTLENEIILFLALNGAGAGGFDKLAPLSRIDDGMLDFVAIKGMSLMELAVLFIKILRGEFTDDPNIIFLREQSFMIEGLTKYHETDLDGERGPNLPVTITCIPEALPVFVPENYR